MLIRTHLAMIIAVLLLFLPHIDNKLVFIFVALIATMLPDVDSAFSTLGSNKAFRILQFFVKHRGFIHSFTFAFFISLIIAIFWPVASLGFFLGYSVHLFLDSFTKEGIEPFWPWKRKSSWRISTGGVMESTFFIILVLFDILLLIFLILGFLS